MRRQLQEEEEKKKKQRGNVPREFPTERLVIENNDREATKAAAVIRSRVFQPLSRSTATARNAVARSVANLSEAPTEELTMNNKEAAEKKKIAYGVGVGVVAADGSTSKRGGVTEQVEEHLSGSAGGSHAMGVNDGVERFEWDSPPPLQLDSIPTEEMEDYLSRRRVGAYRVGINNEGERIADPGMVTPAPLEADPFTMVPAKGVAHGVVADESDIDNNGRQLSPQEVQNLQDQLNRSTKRNKMLCVMLVVVLLIAVAIGATVVMLATGGDDENPSPGDPANETQPTPAPIPLTAAPVAPTLKPTPTAPLDRQELENQITLLSPSTNFAAGTPQRLALDWLVTDAYSQGRMESGDLTKVLQRFGLAVFYFATNGQSDWDFATFWLNARDECGLWFGITCNEGGRVSRVNMQSNQIQGSIPVELLIFTQDSVTFFNLAQNELVDTIPSYVGSMRSLTDLRLFENNLEGTIPTEITNLSLLRHLDVGQNELYGPVPPMPLGNGLLTHLDLSENRALLGPLPDNGFENLVLIEEMYIFGTLLTGTISNELCDTLEKAWIDCGKVACDCCTADLGSACPALSPASSVSGTPLPTAIISNPMPAVAPVASVETLSPVKPSLAGSTTNPAIPPTDDVMVATIKEMLERNGVTAKTDSSPQGQAFSHMVQDPFFVDNDLRIVQRYALLVLWFATDGPSSWVQMPGIDGSDSGWASSSDHCSWSRIECFDSSSLIHKIHLDCGDSSCDGVRGQLPTELGLITTVELLDFNFHSTITGTIPKEIGRLTALTRLDLNGLTGLNPGPVPDYLFVASLEWLGLSNSQYTGTIPTINTLSNLTQLYLFDNDITGGNLNQLCDTLEEPAAVDCDDGIECDCCREGSALWTFGEDCPSS